MNPTEQQQTGTTPPEPPKKEKFVPEFDIADLMVSDRITQSTRDKFLEQEIERREFNHCFRVAEAMEAAGYFYAGGDDSKNKLTKFQAMAKILIGRDYGLSPADAIRWIYLVNGRPAVENRIVAARMQQAGWNWHTVHLGTDEMTKGCKLFIFKDGKPYMQQRVDDKGNLLYDPQGQPLMEQVSVKFLQSDAERAKLLTKDPWMKWPRDLYYWKCIALLHKFHCPGILHGAITAAEAMDAGEFEVYDGPPRKEEDDPKPKAKRAAVIEKVNESIKGEKPEAAKAEPAKEPEPSTTTTGLKDTPSQWPTQQELPTDAQFITERTRKAIEKYEALLTTEKWSKVLVAAGFDNLKSIMSEEDGRRVLLALADAAGK